jgi:hypothetical protein
MKCPKCKRKMDDLTHGYGEHRNYICKKCNTHNWKNKFYTKKEWETYINGN